MLLKINLTRHLNCQVLPKFSVLFLLTFPQLNGSQRGDAVVPLATGRQDLLLFFKIISLARIIGILQEMARKRGRGMKISE